MPTSFQARFGWANTPMVILVAGVATLTVKTAKSIVSRSTLYHLHSIAK